MRITFLAQLYPPEGGAAATRIYEFATRLAARDHEVCVFAQTPNYPSGVVPRKYRRRLCFKEELDGVAVRRCFTIAASRMSRTRTMASWLSYAMSACWLAGFTGPRPDVIIGTSPTLFTARAAAMVSCLRRRPFVMDIRDVWPDYMIHSEWLKPGWVSSILDRIGRACYRRASRIIVTTEGQRELVTAKGVSPDKITIIPNGANVDLFRPGIPPTETTLRLRPEGRFVLTYAGYFAESQGLDKVLEAARHVQEQDDEVLFILAGDGRTRNGLESLCQELELENVTFTGEISREEVASLLCASDVGLVPHGSSALTENIPAKLFDVMACGKPVLLVSKGEPAKLVERANAGLVAEPGNVRQLADTILQMKHRADLLHQYGHNAHQHVVQHYNREIGAHQLEQLLLEVVGE